MEYAPYIFVLLRTVVPFSFPCATPDLSTKKKRNRNPLLPNSRDKKVIDLSKVKQLLRQFVKVCEKFVFLSESAYQIHLNFLNYKRIVKFQRHEAC